MSRLRATLALLLCIAQPGLAQEKKGGVAATIEVEILSLDVLALDKKDHPVLGLTQADFEVRVAGKLQPFEFFEAPRGPSRRGGADSPERVVGAAEPLRNDGRALPHVLFYVDLEQLPRLAIQTAAAAIQETTSHLAGSARLGLVTYLGDAQILAWDTASVETVLTEMQATHDAAFEGSRLNEDSLGAGALSGTTAYESRVTFENFLINGIISTESSGGDPTAQYQTVSRYLVEERDRVKRSVETLRKVAARFATLGETRHLIFVSQGIERVPGANFVSRLEVSRASSGGAETFQNPVTLRTERIASGRASRAGPSRFVFIPIPLTDLDGLRTWLAASGVTFHFLDAMPLGSDLETSEDKFHLGAGSQHANERQSLEDSAVRLVEVTGGVSRLRPGDLKGSFDVLLDAAASTYRMGVRLTDVDVRKTYKISVSVRKPGVTALARSAYQPQSKAALAAATTGLVDQAARERTEAAADARRAGAARLAKPAIPIATTWKGKAAMASSEAGKAFYQLEVSIPQDELRFKPEEDAMVASVRIVVEAKGLEGPFTETFQDDLFLSYSGPEYKEVRGTDAKKTLTLSLPPGKYELSVTVQDALENRSGSAVQRIEADK